MEHTSVHTSEHMLKHLLLQEESFEKEMQHKVEPYLTKRRTPLYLSHNTNQSLFCVSYLTDTQNPKGVILISHGFTETAEKYKECAYYFLNSGYHVYILEHCGHGRSYRLNTDLSLVHIDRYERYVDDLLLTARTIHKTHPELPLYLYAHSMGGGIGVGSCRCEPEMFHKIILSSPMISTSTGTIPWTVAKLIAYLFCLIGKSGDYVPGHRPFQGEELFEDSASTQSPLSILPKLPSARAAVPNECRLRLALSDRPSESLLLKEATHKINIPLLLLQAENDTFVSARAQEEFIAGLRQHHTPVRLIKLPNTKHEIYQSNNNVLSDYWNTIRTFLNEPE